jgi:hypothetical protein
MMTAFASRRTLQNGLVDERQRFQIPIPPVLQKLVQTISKEVVSPDPPDR